MVTEFVINEDAGLIRAATYGRGVWEADIPDGICPSYLAYTLNSPIEGFQYHESSGQINTNFILVGGANTQIFLKANTFVDLTEGFEAPNNGCIFQAEIGPCDSGGIPDND